MSTSRSTASVSPPEAVSPPAGHFLRNGAGHDLVTVITVDREPHFRPQSPLDVPRNPRQVGGVLLLRMTLAELIERNEEVMAKDGRFWYLPAELLETARDGRLIRGRSELGPSTATDSVDAGSRRAAEALAAEKSDVGRENAVEYSAGETCDGRGDRRGAPGSAAADSVDAAGRRRPGARHIAEDALRLLGRVAAELAEGVLDQAEQLATARSGPRACIEAADIRVAAEIVADVGTRRRIRWERVDIAERSEGGA